MRAVFDSNIVISALAFGGRPKATLERVFDGTITLIAAEEIYAEMSRIVRKKFPEAFPEYHALERALRKIAITVPLGTLDINVCRDQNDNFLIETALIGEAECIVSGDRDLLSLGSYKNIRIVTPAQFLEQYPTGN